MGIMGSFLVSNFSLAVVTQSPRGSAKNGFRKNPFRKHAYGGEFFPNTH
jgi:hypothetical protein